MSEVSFSSSSIIVFLSEKVNQKPVFFCLGKPRAVFSMPWPRLSAKERGNCGAAGVGGRVNADDEVADKASSVPMRKENSSSIGCFGAATLNASLAPVSRSLTTIQARQPSQTSAPGRIHGLLKPRVSFVLRY